MLDRQVGNAAARVEPVWRRKCACRTRVEAGAALAAMVRFRLVGRKLEIREDRAQEQPGAEIARHQIGVLALPTKSRAGGQWLLEQRRSVNEDLDVRLFRPRCGDQEGAGDQGMMFGYACTESEVYEKGSFMPAPIYFAHKILKVLSEKRRAKQLFDLQPDAKSQVTVQYVDGKPVGCTKVVVSTQHNAQNRNGKKYTPGMVKDLIGDAVASALPKGWMPKKDSDFLVNPTGNFVVGGPDGDCGLTGRKIIVDTYGGYAPHGGGAFSGKDPTKVDRSAAYAARYLAKNVVAAGLAEQCTIQVAYAIGVADPMSLYVDTHGTGKAEEKKLARTLQEIFPLRPTNIRRALKLNRPIYKRTAAYGHFGRAPDKDGGFSWERTDLADALKRALR